MIAGRVDGAARARAHDGADLRDDAARERVAEEDVGVAGERLDPFLDARAARVVEADDGRPDLHGQVHHLADLLRVGARQRAAEDGEVLGEDEDLATVDEPVAGDDAVPEHLLLLHAEIGATVGDEAVELDERPGIDEEVDPLAGRELPPFVLLLDSLLASAEKRATVQLVEAEQVGRRGATGGLASVGHGWGPRIADPRTPA